MVYSLSLEKNNTMVLSGRKVLLVALTIVTAILPVKAEGLKFNLAFDGLFDNREFKGDVMPQTIYGMRLTPEIGIERGNHLIMGGVSKIWEFGSKGDIDPTPVLYYKFTQDKWSASFGNIPRTHLQRQLPGMRVERLRLVSVGVAAALVRALVPARSEVELPLELHGEVVHPGHHGREALQAFVHERLHHFNNFCIIRLCCVHSILFLWLLKEYYEQARTTTPRGCRLFLSVIEVLSSSFS